MIDHILYFGLMVLISVGMSQFLDNAFGYPGKQFSEDIDVGAIFFVYTYQLAYARVELVRGTQWIRDLKTSFQTSFGDQAAMIIEKRDFERAIVAEGRKYFGWERAVGMCIYCTNFWISMLVCAFFGLFNPLESSIPFYFLIFTIPFLSHLILKHVITRAN